VGQINTTAVLSKRKRGETAKKKHNQKETKIGKKGWGACGVYDMHELEDTRSLGREGISVAYTGKGQRETSDGTPIQRI